MPPPVEKFPGVYQQPRPNGPPSSGSRFLGGGGGRGGGPPGDGDDPGAPLPSFVTLPVFLAALTQPEFVIDVIAQRGRLYSVCAHPGHGKSSLFVGAALAIATGRPDILGLAAQRGRCVLVSYENSDNLREQLIAGCHKWGIDADEALDAILVCEDWATPERLCAGLERLSLSLDAVFIESHMVAFDGKNPDDAAEAARFIRRLRPLTMLNGSPAVWVATHPTKHADKANLVPSNSGQVIAQVDVNLTLWQHDGGDIIELHWAKKFRGTQFEPLTFKLEQMQPDRLKDSAGRPKFVPVLITTAEQDAENREAEANRKLVAALQIVAENPTISWRELAKLSGIPPQSFRRTAVPRYASQNEAGWTITSAGKKLLEDYQKRYGILL